MRKAGDPVAQALFEQYRQMQMPNLQLSDEQIQELLGYLDRSDSAMIR